LPIVAKLSKDAGSSNVVTVNSIVDGKNILYFTIFGLLLPGTWNSQTQAFLDPHHAISKPVVTVNVGEISDYLADDVNSFLVEPYDCNGLSEKLDYVLNNYELALKIAQLGK
jgi:glycosyltransferase involved in cell wall biosynthesis